MAWNTITDVNDGQSWGGTNFQEVQDAIAQLQGALGPDEGRVMQRIDRQVTAGGVTAVTFPNIPQTFDHLRIIARPRHNNGSAGDAFRSIGVRFNGDSSLLYDFNSSYVLGNTSTVTTQVGDNGASAVIGYAGTQPGSLVVDIPDYRSVGTGSRTASATGSARIGSVTSADTRNVLSAEGVWSSGAAITEVQVLLPAPGGDVFVDGLVFSLYGMP